MAVCVESVMKIWPTGKKLFALWCLISFSRSLIIPEWLCYPPWIQASFTYWRRWAVRVGCLHFKPATFLHAWSYLNSNLKYWTIVNVPLLLIISIISSGKGPLNVGPIGSIHLPCLFPNCTRWFFSVNRTLLYCSWTRINYYLFLIQ